MGLKIRYNEAVVARFGRVIQGLRISSPRVCQGVLTKSLKLGNSLFLRMM